MKIKLIFPLILLFITQTVLIFLGSIISQNLIHITNIINTFNLRSILPTTNFIFFLATSPYLFKIILIFIFTFNCLLLVSIYKLLNKNQMQISQTQLKFDSLLNALKKFVSHDIRKPLNLSKMLNSSLESNKSIAIIKGIAGEIEKSATKIEGFSDNVLIYCNYLTFKLENITINEIKYCLIELLQDEKNIKINIPDNIFDTIEVNKLYFTKSIKNLISFFKNRIKLSEIIINYSHNNFSILFIIVSSENKDNILAFKNALKNEFEIQVIETILVKNNCNSSFSIKSSNLEFKISMPGNYSFKGKQYG